MPKTKIISKTTPKSKSNKGLIGRSKFKFDKTLVTAIALVVVATGGYIYFQGSHAAGVPASDGIASGQCYTAGQKGTNGIVTMSMQTDGNFVLYKGSTALWNTSTAGSGSKNRMCMQTDGNLVLYTSANKVLWQSHTSGFSHDRIYLNQFPDAMSMGLSVGYNPSNASNGIYGKSPWISSKRSSLDNYFDILTIGSQLTSPNGSHRLVFQTDGNLVIYNAKNVAIWNTGTAGTAARYFGTLSGKSPYSPYLALWNTSAVPVKVVGPSSNGRYVTMQDDGNLVLYSTDNKPLWSSGTAGK